MRFLGNLLWLALGGFLSGLGWLAAGCLWCITMVARPCGFESRCQHHGSLGDPLCGLLGFFLFLENVLDHTCGEFLALHIQVSIYVAGGGNVAVAEPLLDRFQIHTVGKQQTGTAVAKIVKTNLPEVVFGKNDCEMVGYKSWHRSSY